MTGCPRCKEPHDLKFKGDKPIRLWGYGWITLSVFHCNRCGLLFGLDDGGVLKHRIEAGMELKEHIGGKTKKI